MACGTEGRHHPLSGFRVGLGCARPDARAAVAVDCGDEGRRSWARHDVRGGRARAVTHRVAARDPGRVAQAAYRHRGDDDGHPASGRAVHGWGAAGGTSSGGADHGATAESVIEHWRLVEADFTREYGIELATAMESMTWRRFLVLLGGLSSRSRTAHALAPDGKRARQRSGPVRRLDKDGASAHFATIR